MKYSVKGKEQYKLLVFIAMFYLTTDIVSTILGYHFVKLSLIVEPASFFIYVLTFPTGDIIAEVYGFTTFKKILWARLACDYIFGLFLFLGLMLPSAPHQAHVINYSNLPQYYMRALLGGTLGMLSASFLNGFSLTVWKNKLQGRLFWLRSIGATMVGSVANVVFTVIIAYPGTASTSQMIKFTYWSIILELIIMAFLGPLANIFVFFIKRFEKVDVYEHQLNFNPFILKKTEEKN